VVLSGARYLSLVISAKVASQTLYSSNVNPSTAVKLAIRSTKCYYRYIGGSTFRICFKRIIYFGSFYFYLERGFAT